MARVQALECLDDCPPVTADGVGKLVQLVFIGNALNPLERPFAFADGGPAVGDNLRCCCVAAVNELA